jgi:hypothetical protein
MRAPRLWTTIAFTLAFAPSVAFASSEPRKTDSGLPERWATPDVVVVLDPSIDEELVAGASDTIQKAMQTWYADVVGIPRITFVNGAEHVGAAYDGKSVISAGPITLPGHEKDLAVTTTYAMDESGDILEADIVFNTRYAFATMPVVPSSCDEIFDIGAVATHESGHFFGLDEDYVDSTTTMYIVTKPCDAHKRVLTDGDTDSISALYKPPDTLTAAMCDAAPSPRSSRMGAAVALGLGLLALGRRARERARDL